MSTKFESLGVGPSTLNAYHLSFLSKTLGSSLECPISQDHFAFPYTSPCGHTFDYVNISQSLEYKKSCPIDRQPLTSEQLVPNLFAKELVEQRLMIVYLSVKRIWFDHECAISREPLFEAVKLPCGHSFNQSAIRRWYEKVRKCCPLDNEEFDISDITHDVKKSTLAKTEYPKYLEKVKLFNRDMTSKVITLNLDDRNLLIKKLFEIIKCPISKEIMKTPVLSTCGHTFDIDSISEDSHCPYDSKKIEKSKAVSNRLAKDIIELLGNKCFQNEELNLTADREDRTGTFLFLSPDTTLDKVIKIATSLGILRPILRATDWPRLIVKGQHIFDLETPISQIKLLNDTSEGIPLLHIMQ